MSASAWVPAQNGVVFTPWLPDCVIVYIICFILPELSSVVSIYIWMQERNMFLHASERNAFRRVPSRVPEGWSWWTKGRDSHHPSRSWPCSSRKYWYRLFTDPYFFFVRSSRSSSYRYGRPSWFHIDLTLIQDGRQQNKKPLISMILQKNRGLWTV